LSNARVEKHWLFNRVFRRAYGDSVVRKQHGCPTFFMAKDHTRYCGLVRRRNAEKQ